MGICVPLALPVALEKQIYSALGMPSETSWGRTRRKQEENNSEQGNISMKAISRLWIIEPLVKLVKQRVLGTLEGQTWKAKYLYEGERSW